MARFLVVAQTNDWWMDVLTSSQNLSQSHRLLQFWSQIMLSGLCSTSPWTLHSGELVHAQRLGQQVARSAGNDGWNCVTWPYPVNCEVHAYTMMLRFTYRVEGEWQDSYVVTSECTWTKASFSREGHSFLLFIYQNFKAHGLHAGLLGTPSVPNYKSF